MINLNYVELFLKTAKREIKKGNRYFVLNRTVKYDNKVISAKKALLELGLSKVEDIWMYVLDLESRDCIGIGRDYDYKRDYNDDMYEFIKYISGIKTYIKLTINNRGTVCLSFHKSDR